MRTLFIFLAIGAGIVLPYGADLAFLIRYAVMAMLFFAFLEMPVYRGMVRLSHLWVLVANVGMALLCYSLARPFGDTLAATGFVLGILPTAAAAPVITAFLGQRVAYVAFAVLIGNGAIAAILPFLLPYFLATPDEIGVSTILFPVLMLVFIPLLLAFAIRSYTPGLKRLLLRIKALAMLLFLFNIYVAMCRATRFVQTEMEGPLSELAVIGGLTVLICAANFGLGYLLDQKGYSNESSMALGRKNTMFGVWIALDFLNPIVALGPLAYIFCQNSWLAILMARKKDT